MPDLRTFLRLDAFASGGVGVLLLVLINPAEDELGLPVGFTIGAALVMIGWAAFVSWVSTTSSRALANEVVALNVVYVVISVVITVADWIDLTDLGVAFVLAQAAVVLGLTVGQYAGLRAEDRELVAA